MVDYAVASLLMLCRKDGVRMNLVKKKLRKNLFGKMKQGDLRKRLTWFLILFGWLIVIVPAVIVSLTGYQFSSFLEMFLVFAGLMSFSILIQVVVLAVTGFR